MKAIVIGMGVQGNKRKKILGNEFVFSVDSKKKADYKIISDVPLKLFDTVFLCVPDDQKIEIIKYCLKNKKNILVEKPLLSNSNQVLRNIESLANKNKVICYTAYNHRFEPSILKLKKIINTQNLGKFYKCNIFYGNGTSSLVKKSKWRDKELGVVTDLGSHLIDICLYIFGNKIKNLKILEINKFENIAPDHAIISMKINNIKIILEMSLCMWKNTFYFDLISSRGSVHLKSLSKWSKNSIAFRKRKYPSGKPNEKIYLYKKGDPTWKNELQHFKKLISLKKNTNLKNDLIINQIFLKIKENI